MRGMRRRRLVPWAWVPLLAASIAIGTDGFPVISYYDATNQDLKVADCGDADCSSATLITIDAAEIVGQDTSIAIGADGYPVISYYDATKSALKVARIVAGL